MESSKISIPDGNTGNIDKDSSNSSDIIENILQAESIV
jgi:hypothetical protein